MWNILNNNKNVISIDSLEQYLKWSKDFDNRVVGRVTLDNFWTSTVFLGIGYGHGKQLWFETMIFPNNDMTELYCDRYETWQEAISGHIHATFKMIMMDVDLPNPNCNISNIAKSAFDQIKEVNTEYLLECFAREVADGRLSNSN